MSAMRRIGTAVNGTVVVALAALVAIFLGAPMLERVRAGDDKSPATIPDMIETSTINGVVYLNGSVIDVCEWVDYEAAKHDTSALVWDAVERCYRLG